jgi:hypothetical protein
VRLPDPGDGGVEREAIVPEQADHAAAHFGHAETSMNRPFQASAPDPSLGSLGMAGWLCRRVAWEDRGGPPAKTRPTSKPGFLSRLEALPGFDPAGKALPGQSSA